VERHVGAAAGRAGAAAPVFGDLARCLRHFTLNHTELNTTTLKTPRI
jgi:hypothetical protein